MKKADARLFPGSCWRSVHIGILKIVVFAGLSYRVHLLLGFSRHHCLFCMLPFLSFWLLSRILRTILIHMYTDIADIDAPARAHEHNIVMRATCKPGSIIISCYEGTLNITTEGCSPRLPRFRVIRTSKPLVLTTRGKL